MMDIIFSLSSKALALLLVSSVFETSKGGDFKIGSE